MSEICEGKNTPSLKFSSMSKWKKIGKLYPKFSHLEFINWSDILFFSTYFKNFLLLVIFQNFQVFLRNFQILFQTFTSGSRKRPSLCARDSVGEVVARQHTRTQRTGPFAAYPLTPSLLPTHPIYTFLATPLTVGIVEMRAIFLSFSENYLFIILTEYFLNLVFNISPIMSLNVCIRTLQKSFRTSSWMLALLETLKKVA